MSPRYDCTDLAILANQHRPTDHAALRREVLSLGAQGLKPRDIAGALGLNDHDVVTMLYSSDELGAV